MDLFLVRVIRRTPGHRELIYSDQSSCPKLYWNYDGGTKVEEKDSNSKPSNNSSNHSFNKTMDTMSGDPNFVFSDCVVFFDCRICESIDRTLLSLDLNIKHNTSLHYVADTLLSVARTNLYSHFVLRHEPPVQYCISIVSRLSLSTSLRTCFA